MRLHLAQACCLALLVATLPAQAKKTPKKVQEIKAIQAEGEIAEDSLLDVGIQVFGHGMPDDEDALFDLEEKGIQEHPKTDGVRFLSETLMGGFHKMGDQEVTKRVSIY